MAATTRGPDPSESVPALAAQLADLRGTVTGLAARLDHYGLAGDLGDTAGLADRITAVEQQLHDLAAEGDAPAVSAPVWHTLDTDAYREQLDRLAAWVDGFLIPAYQPPLTSCWRQHVTVLWELGTLYAEWRRVYERKHPQLSGALAWHDRWLPGVSTRLSAVLADCKHGCALAPRIHRAG